MLTRICPDIMSLALAPSPIPRDWIRAGTPEASVAEIGRSRDGLEVCAVWACTEGAFEWQFDVDETVHILDGAVTVTDGQGRLVRLVPGDVAIFAAGTSSHWQVHGHVRKLAICRRPVPWPAGFALKAWARLRVLLTPYMPRLGAAPTAMMMLLLS